VNVNVSHHAQARKIYKLCHDETQQCIIRVKAGPSACDVCLGLDDECPARSVMRHIDTQYAEYGDLVRLHGLKNIKNGAVHITIDDEIQDG
jgi:hypothetical protein